MQEWSVPLQVFRILKRELPNVAPVDYMKHLDEINYDAENEIYELVGATGYLDDLISQVFVKQNPGTSEILLKYMPTVQYGQMWNKFYRQCRGTVIDMDRMVAFHSYDKWFNVSEMPETDEQTLTELSQRIGYRVMNKWDGSLIMAYYNRHWNLVTNGSFDSAQSKWAKEYARQYHVLDGLDTHYTYMFEAIYPDNRIVVNYDGVTEMVPLARRNMITGELELPDATMSKFYEDKTFQQILSERGQYGATQKEGWVVRFDNGLMVKVKCLDYVRVHKLKDSINPKGVFEMMQTNTLDDVRASLPVDVRNEIDAIVVVYMQWERSLRAKIASIDITDPNDRKGVFTAVRNVFPDGGFEQWYALKCVRGEIDTDQSPLAYVKSFDNVSYLFADSVANL